MDENNSIQLFEDRKIRTAWDEEKEEWYFSVQDVVAVLSESTDPKQYIKKMRTRDPQLSANWGTICTPVQMLAADGKQRKVQAANTEGILRIIQSIPSPKAEPFKALSWYQDKVRYSEKKIIWTYRADRWHSHRIAKNATYLTRNNILLQTVKWAD